MSLRPLVRGLLVVMTVLLSAVACGVSMDESPRIISSDELPNALRPGQLPSATPLQASASGPGREQVHMIQNNLLVTVERQIVHTPEALMEILLLDTFPEEASQGIQSAIFRGTKVQGVEVNDLFDLAIVDLAPGSLDPSNSEQRLAFAQIVFTLTSLPGIESVQFVQSDPANPDEEPIELAVQIDTGTTLPGARVTRDDFALLSPGNAVPLPSFDIPILTPTPTPDPNAPPAFELAIWMLDEAGHLTKVTRTLERTKEAFLVALLEGPLIDERTKGIRSALPPDALARTLTVANFDVLRIDEFGFEELKSANIATVDLESGSLPPDANGNDRFLAAAQIVFTLTELTEIDQVVFSLNGLPIPIPTDRGLSLPFDPNVPSGLQRSDFASALNEPDPAPTPAPETTAEAAPVVSPTPTPTPGS